MKNKNVFLLLNGETPNYLPDLSSYDLICATDGAYDFLKKQNIRPNFISGDFDSISENSDDIIKIHTPNQNLTDFDKILKLIHEKGFYKVDVYGASGKEQDHFLGNLHSALRWFKKLKITFYDNYSYYFIADKKTVIKDCKGKIISLIPFHIAKDITTKGLKYSLYKEDLELGNNIGIRNLAENDEIEIKFNSGNLIIFVNN